MKKFFLPVLTLISFFLLSTCEVGMGQALDLEAPVITVTSPVTLSNVHKNFRIEGTCYDNESVSAVEIKDKQKDEVIARANVSGDKWYADLSLEEGEKTLMCIARDAAGNQSTKSIKTVIYLVDETAPEGLSWYVDRGNNVQTPLLEYETLKDNLNYDDFTNIDIPQNEKFTIYGRFYDAMSINKIKVSLYENGNLVKESEVDAVSIPTNESIYSPHFDFTAADFPTLTTGKHYLQVRYTASDDHGNTYREDVELPYVLWWPESDYPTISFNGLTETINIGSAIPIHFFDDDLLEEVKYALDSSVSLSATTLAECSGVTWTNGQTNISSKSRRDLPVQDLSAPGTPCTINLVAYAKDVNGKETVRVCKLQVTDAKKPLIVIDSPEENTKPSIYTKFDASDGKEHYLFDIVGHALDSTGCKEIKVAYIPGRKGSEAELRAKELFANATAENGEFVRTITLGDLIPENKWQRQNFKFTFDLLNDFKDETVSCAKEDKFFEFVLKDNDNLEVYKQHVLSGDKNGPTIEIEKPITDMYVYDYSDQGEDCLEIKFKASKNSGLGINDDLYGIEITWSNEDKWTYSNKKSTAGTCTSDGEFAVGADGYARVKLKRSEIAKKVDVNPQPTITFTAGDVLDNMTTERRNVVLSPLPQLVKILSGNMNGTYKKGDTLTFQAVFTQAVKVNGDPKLLLKLSDTKDPVEASLKGNYGNRTDTLVFTYVVEEGHESDNLSCDNTNPIKLGTGDKVTEIAIMTASTGEGNAHLTTLQKENTLPGKAFVIDGICPTITKVTVAPEDSSIKKNADGNYYLKANEVIKATVEFSENVNISGSPVLKLYGGPSGSSSIDFNLQSIENNVIVFTHTIKVKPNQSSTIVSTPEGELKYNLKSSFEESFTETVGEGSNKKTTGYVESIKDIAGNPLKLSKDGNATCHLFIDTTKPSSYPAINIAGGDDKKYNTNQVLNLSGETGTTIEYSHNGGISWWVYDGPVTLTSTKFTAKKKNAAGTLVEQVVNVSGGEYTIKTRQTDKAGNVSEETPDNNASHFTIKNTFPTPTSIVISKPDGKYPANTKVKFVLTYPEKIKAPDATSIVLKFKVGDTERSVNVKPETTGSERMEFEYTSKGMSDGNGPDDGKGIYVTQIVYSQVSGKKPVDLFNNSPDENISNPSWAVNRPDITLDGRPPVILTDGYTPAIKGIVSNGNIIKLVFSEIVEKEEGMIYLVRKSTEDEPWRIPPVMTEEEFNSVYNELSTEDKAVLMRLDNDAPELCSYNGQPIGPYKRITHGLVGGDGSSTLPDTSTKFVLDFNIGISKGFGYLADGTKVTVASLREVFEKAKYHYQAIEVTDPSVSIKEVTKNGNKCSEVTIEFPKALVDGREWEVYLDPNVFRDKTGNLYEGLGTYSNNEDGTISFEGSSYSFWSNKVAKPWVRVDRYSHGYAAIEPTVDDKGNYNGVKIISSYGTSSAANVTAVNAANTKPTGYARVRIDCETPGATIKYGVGSSGTNGVVGTCSPNSTTSNLWTDSTTVADTNLADITPETTYSGYFVVGDGQLYTARRDFVKAQGTKTNFTSSSYGYEGVFKTVVTYRTSSNQNYMKTEGGSGAGGMPAYGGFPVRDAEEGKGHDKGCYTIGSNQFLWQTYDIVSTWWILGYNGNYTNKYYWAGYGYPNHVYINNTFYSNPGAAQDIAAGYTLSADLFK